MHVMHDTDCQVQLILCKDNANEGNECSLSNCRVQLIRCKDNANEGNENSLSNYRVQLILYKDNASASAMELAQIAEPQHILCKYRQII